MKGTRAISFLLVFALMASLVVPGFFAQPARAEGTTDNGMRIRKTATKNDDDGSYTITLEAYATGSKVISEVKKDIPTDIVLVLDQSGSMKETMKSYDFRLYSDKTNSNYYNLRHNGNNTNNANLYYKLDDGGYATVSVVGTEIANSNRYTECSASWTNRDYYYQRNNLYQKVGEEYKNVTISYTSEWDWNTYETIYTFTYTFPDGSTYTSVGGDTSPGNFDGKGPLYYYSNNNQQREYEYTYSYTDQSGVTHEIGTSQGANTTPDYPLYERYSTSTTTRLEALKSAVTGFADSVAAKAAGADGIPENEDDVDHRIAVVGFSCSNTGSYNSYNDYQNTELFIGSNQYKYGTAAQGQYANAFQNMKTTAGQANVTASINALDADGATYVNHGLEIANGILNANPVPTDKERNRVVIVFTDGVPGYSGFEDGVATSAITQASTSRSYGANVYAVGIFEGADATSAGNSGGTDTQKANWFMQNLSDNKGTPRSPSYYLSASDSGTLSSIFQQIANNIESGGSNTTLTEETVIKDIVAPQFTLPEGASASNITLKTYRYTGVDNAGVDTWAENEKAMGATAEVDGDRVSVTGFNFSENWCGTVTENGNTTYRGNKLVISFDVVPKTGFLGGNDVYTNASAGVYADATATDPVVPFPRPQVNVPIKDVTVTATDKNVYLKGEVTADQLKAGSEISVGNAKLDLSKATDENKPYGLDPWQTEYVDITVTVKDKNGNVISDKLDNLTDDTTYTVEVTVAPKTVGKSTPEKGDAATAKTGVNAPAAKINVFKPELTFKDSTAYYGESVPANNDYSSNKVGSETWKHGDTVSTDVTMLGEKPTLDISYTPDASKLEGGKYTKQDVPVAATVKIGTENINEQTTFVHQDCDPACDWVAPATHGDPAFLIHIQTCTLNITKQGGAAGEPYVFDVYKNDTKYSEVSIVGNSTATIVELPVGTYSIREDTDWSWRYPNPIYTGNGVTLDATNANGEIICTNTSNENKWLNGFSTVVANIFGIAKQ